MEHTTQWTIALYLDEQDGQTRARARLLTGENEVSGVGYARRHPYDRDVPEIGDELAAARALADLAHTLFETTISDIEAVTHRPAAVAP